MNPKTPEPFSSPSPSSAPRHGKPYDRNPPFPGTPINAPNDAAPNDAKAPVAKTAPAPPAVPPAPNPSRFAQTHGDGWPKAPKDSAQYDPADDRVTDKR